MSLFNIEKAKTYFSLFFCVIAPQMFLAQDVTVFKGPNFQGEQVNMMIGDEFIIDPPIATISFIKHKADAAILVEALNPVPNNVENWYGIYNEMFYYSDEWKRSGIPGTDQYASTQTHLGIPVKVRCIKKKLPQPDIYIPIDASNVHPEATPFPYSSQNKTMLYLKRSFFWENSEDLLCNLDPDADEDVQSPHGPTGDIKISVCRTSAADYSLDSLSKFQHLWDIRNEGGCDVHIVKGPLGVHVTTDCESRLIEFKLDDFLSYYDFDYSQNFDTTIHLLQTQYHANTLFGPVYVSPPACDADLFLDDIYSPVAHNEWIDGPWGAYYSNVAVIDWDALPDDEYALVVSEADKPFDYLVASSSNLSDVIGVVKVKRTETNDMLVNVGTCGWIILKNEMPSSTSVEHLKHFWYPTWNGMYPELVLGATGPSKHFEKENYFCEDVGDQCATIFNSFINDDYVKRVYINPVERDTFRVYSVYNIGNIDTTYSSDVKTDSLYWLKPKATSPVTYDSLITTPYSLYRKWGSQYQPYYTYAQLERYLLDRSEIGIYGGVIPANNYLKKQMTLLPLDPELGMHKKAINQYAELKQNPNSTYRQYPHQNQGYFQAYPNPTTSWIQWPDKYGKNASIIGASGKTLLVSLNQNRMDLSLLPGGIYILRLQDENGKINFTKVVRN